MSEFKVGDTVDPRTLPVGAVFQLTDGTRHWTVTRQRSDATECGSGGLPGLVPHDKHVILLSLPSDPVELLGDVIGSWFEFDAAEQALTSNDRRIQQALKLQGREVITNLGYTYFATRKVHRRPAPTPQPAKRPPCDACGEESTADLDGVHSVEDSAVHLCGFCFYNKRPARLFEDIQARRARRAAQASPERPIVEPMSAASENPPRKSTGPSSLPTYDQIAGWLGAEWVMMCSGFDDPAPREWPAMEQPSPWTHRVFVGDYQCSLLHAPTGQRVEVTAPREAISEARWRVWFGYIAKRDREMGSKRYTQHVRWLDPDTKDSTGSEGGEAPDSLSREPSQATPSEPVLPPRCSSCKQPFWAGRPSCFYDTLCGDCFRSGCVDEADHLTNDLDTRIAEVAEPEVRIENMPGAWATACDEGLS